MVLVTLALLCSCPIHKEAEMVMYHRHSHDHIEGDSECRNSGQESKNQAESAKEFCGDRQERERRRNVHDAGEKTHRSGEAVSAKPTQHLLGTMCEENHA